MIDKGKGSLLFGIYKSKQTARETQASHHPHKVQTLKHHQMNGKHFRSLNFAANSRRA